MQKGSRIGKDAFARVSKEGKRLFGRSLTLVVSPAERAAYAAVVSKKVAKTAVKRNLLRRRIFAILRAFTKESGTRGSFIVYAKKESAAQTFAELRDELSALLHAAPPSLRSGDASGRIVR